MICSLIWGLFLKGLLWGLFVEGPLWREEIREHDMDKSLRALVTMNRQDALLVFGNQPQVSY
jgi:hypothetical protein